MSHWTLACILMAASAGSNTPACASLTPEELRGRRIYMRGIGAAGTEITAVLEGGGVELSGSSITCSGCHGADGRGRPEGGVTPSNIRWEALIRPYATAGRAHQPYNERSLLRAIAMGVDPAGNALARTMPRFHLTRSDMADLIAWLKKIGSG